VVNEEFMRLVGRNPVGARVRTLQRGSERELGPWHEIVGVVTNLAMFPADWSGAAYIYRAASPAEFDPVVVAVRVAGDAAPLAPRVAAVARRVDAGLHLRDVVTLDDVVAQEQVRMLGGTVVFGSVLLVAVVFSAAGLYALMAVAVARRTREIGIRLALGANPRHVLGSVFARAGRQLGGGIIAGNSLILLLAWRADSLTVDLLVSSVITSVIMAAVGVLACAAPARRALRVQPTEALRQG
jgi:flagellin-like protein